VEPGANPAAVGRSKSVKELYVSGLISKEVYDAKVSEIMAGKAPRAPDAAPQAPKRTWWLPGETPLPRPSEEAIAKLDGDGHVSRVAQDAENIKVRFEFYSSCESQAQFAYLYKLGDKWRVERMKKDGNRFYIEHPVADEIWYQFVGMQANHPPMRMRST
jgi:hypothetical protein